MATVVDDLVAGVDKVRLLEPSSFDDDSLQAAMLSLQQSESALAVVAARFLAEWEQRRGWRADGTVRAVDALSRDARKDPRAARRELRRARKLAEMPHTEAAVAAGRLTIAVVDLMLLYATDVRWASFVRDEQMLVDHLADQRLWDSMRQTMAYWAMRVDDELDLAPAHSEPSRVYLSRHEVTGEGDLSGHLGTIDAEIVETELNRLMKQIAADDRTTGIMRSGGERRAEALVRMAARSVNATGVTARPLLQIIVGSDTAARLCETASGVVLHPSQLEPLLATAVIETFLFDGPVNIIGVSRKRTFTGAVRRAIQVRDRHCQHAAGCSARIPDCDVDHIVPWIVGGDTTPSNGRLLCTPQNRNAALRDRPSPQTRRAYGALDEKIARTGACAAFFTDATAPPSFN